MTSLWIIGSYRSLGGCEGVCTCLLLCEWIFYTVYFGPKSLYTMNLLDTTIGKVLILLLKSNPNITDESWSFIELQP